jgi:hypothetical protein
LNTDDTDLMDNVGFLFLKIRLDPCHPCSFLICVYSVALSGEEIESLLIEV